MNNFERMIELANEVFSARTDLDQLDVDEKIMEKLQSIHPATLSEHVEGDGPVVWILLIPTTTVVMEKFISKKIGERQLLEQTTPGEKYDSLYLCSALVLPEFRKKGLASKVTLNAVKEIQNDHAIKTLFVWPFSNEGEQLATQLAKKLHLPLLTRPH